MNDSPHCPVCARAEFDVLGHRRYRLSELELLEPEAYVAKRYRVLFDVWLDGQTELTIKSLLCRHCGMVIYGPRPSAEDLERKYRFLTKLGRDHVAVEPNVDADQIRAADLFRNLKGRLPRQADILDYGGGDGRLMRPFVADGHRCGVVDYVPDTIDSVPRIAETLDQLTAGVQFDAIVCLHILEHLAQPFEVVSELREHLRPNGTLFVEVPMEIWREPPMHPEPVTHVNFFTIDSIRHLLARAGYRVSRCIMTRHTHPDGHQPTAIRAWATPTGTPKITVPYGAARNTRRLLEPDLLMLLHMARIRPDWIRNRIKQFVSKITG